MINMENNLNMPRIPLIGENAPAFSGPSTT
jgi:hypothetical protein